MMNRSRRPTITSPTSHIRSYSFRPFLSLILAGCLLSFLAGYINSICLISSFQMSISALTGTTSKMMIDLAKGNVSMTIHFFILIVCFVLGNFLSGALVGGSSFRIQRPYGVVLLIASAALAFGAIFEKTIFKLYETSISLQIGAYFVSLACGLQNGMCTTFSGAVIRTTHVTGILTDIGLVLGQAVFHRRTRKHLWKLKVLCPLYIGFCFGGLLGGFAYQIWHIRAILFPCLLLAILGITHLCYCKIISALKIKKVNEKHWKRNSISKKLVPTVDNPISHTPIDGQNEGHLKLDPTDVDNDLQIISIDTTQN